MQAAQHVGVNIEHNLHTIANIRPRIVGLTEMAAGPDDDTSLALARKILGASAFTVCTAEDGGAHCHEIPVAIRLGLLYALESVTVTQLSPDLGDGIANDRHLIVVRFRNKLTRRLKAHAHTHWDAGLQGPHGNMIDDDRVKATAAGSQIMEAALTRLLSEGRDLSVTGDFNWRLHDRDPEFHVWVHSPKAMFDRLGLAYVTSGLDWVAWSKRTLHLFGSADIIPPAHSGNGADHPWIVTRLRRRIGR